MRPQTLAALTLATLVALMGITSPVAAIDGDQVIKLVSDTIGDGKEKEHKDRDGKHLYVSLGTIGSVVVTCPGIKRIDYVDVNVLGEPTLTIDFYDFPNETGAGDVVVPVQTSVNSDGVLCLGGASANMPDTDTTFAWDVWITDLVWDRVMDQEVLFDDVFQAAGFARMDLSYDYATTTKDSPEAGEELCLPVNDDGVTPVVCAQPGVGTWTATQSINNFGFCGQGVVNAAGGYRDPWDLMHSDANLPGDIFDRTNKAAKKVVFVDGIDTFLLDCAQSDDVITTINLIGATLNMVTCTGNPLPPLVCFFPLPVDDSHCLNAPPASIPVPGLMGTIGWRHVDDPNKCHEEAFDQDVNDFQPVTYEPKNLPEIPGCEAGDLEEECEEAFGTVEEQLGMGLGAIEIIIVIDED